MMNASIGRYWTNPLPGRLWIFMLLSTMIMGLSACYYRPYSPQSYHEADVNARQSTVPSAQVYFYPKKGQSNEQQSRDHYECYNWAIKTAGFDPGQSPIPKEQRVRVVPMPPPGYDTAALTIAGAVLGALIGGPRHAGEGALIGAAGGAITGAASDAARQQEAQRLEKVYRSQGRSQDDELIRKTLDFRRAMCACLEGRGYTVR
jgi:hypothetical protein